MKEKKLFMILACVVVVMAVALLAIRSAQKQAAEEEQRLEEEREAESVITEPLTYNALRYDNGTETLSFALGENQKWIWADEPEFPLDDSNVTAILDLLETLKPQQTITDGDTLEAYELDDPFASLTATDTQGNTLTISLGKATTDGNSYYMLMNQQESPVYIIADTLYQYMSKSIYEMCDLPELPLLTEDSLKKISVQRGDTSSVLEKHSDGKWFSGDEDVSDHESTTSLLDELAQLSIESCVDFKPTDEAVSICGFDQPVAVEILYSDETGQDQTLTFYLGNAALNQSGRYLRLKGDSTIYRISVLLDV